MYKYWKSRVGVLALTATMGLALVGIASPAGAADPNAAAKALCKNDGWKTLVRADGTRFLSQGECVSYAANGGTPMPPVPALHLTYDGTAVAAYATFTGGSLGAGCNTFALTCDDTTSFASGDYIRMSVQMSCTSTCPDTLSIVAFYNNTSAYGKFDCNNTGTPTDLVCETTVFTDVGDTAVNVTIAS